MRAEKSEYMALCLLCFYAFTMIEKNTTNTGCCPHLDSEHSIQPVMKLNWTHWTRQLCFIGFCRYCHLCYCYWHYSQPTRGMKLLKHNIKITVLTLPGLKYFLQPSNIARKSLRQSLDSSYSQASSLSRMILRSKGLPTVCWYFCKITQQTGQHDDLQRETELCTAL